MVKFISKITNLSQIKRITFRDDINGLRAISVLAVVFYHADISLFKGGWLGVDIFFVISGYLISNIIISELNEGTFSFKYFYLRRIKRILPALFSTLLLTIPLAYFLLTSKSILEYAHSLVSSIFFYSNYYFLNLDFYNAEPAKYIPLLHTWSLAIEEQFYIIFPLFCFLIFKFSRKIFGLLIMLLIIFSLYLNITSVEITKFYQFQFRIWELLIGVLIMILSSNLKLKNISFIGYPIMLFPIFFFDDNWINDIEPKLISLLGVSIILYSNTKWSIFDKLFSNKIVNLIGLSSYSIYLLHQPIFAFFRTYKLTRIENILNQTTEVNSIETLFLLISIICMGYLSFTFIEVKMISKKSQLVGLILCFSTLLVFSFLFSNNKLETIKSRNLPEEIKILSIQENRSTYQDGRSCDNRELIDLCFFDNKSDINVVTVGDSSFRNLQTIVNKSSEAMFNYTQLTHGGCLYIVDTSFRERDCPMYDKGELDSYINNIENSIIIYGGRFPFYMEEERFFNGYVLEKGSFNQSKNLTFEEKKYYIKKTIDLFLSNNNYVILVYPIPEQGWDVYELYYNRTVDWDDDLGYPHEIYKKRASSSYEILDEVNNERIYKILPENIFCDTFIENQCAAKYGNQIFYFDDDHISLDGQRLVSEKILEQIKEIILLHQ
jgi:peptidoglycan/LPS O-acetylase OafA/YrhL